MKIHLDGHQKSGTAGQCFQSRFRAAVARFDGQLHGRSRSPRRISYRLSIAWRLDGIVWVAAEKHGKGNEKEVVFKQPKLRTDDCYILARCSKRAFHQHHLTIRKSVLDGLEIGFVKACESHYRTSCKLPVS